MTSSSGKLDLTELPGKAWLAVPDFQQNLFDELSVDPKNHLQKSGSKVAIYGDLVYREGSSVLSFWNRTVMEKPFIAEFSAISEAAGILKSLQRNWAHYPFSSFRRAELIKEKLPFINAKPRQFPFQVPLAPMGLWTLLDEHTLFASAATSSPFPCGEIRFIEDHVNPPSRAYMKMYEALAWVSYLDAKQEAETPASIPTGRYTKDLQNLKASIPTGRYRSDSTVSTPIISDEKGLNGADTVRIAGLPAPGDRCVDAGACPGGWTWVLRLLGAQVTAIDRAPLDPKLMSDPGVTFIKHDAFTLKPADFGPQDWVCSDVICYPQRLLEWVNEWLASGLCRNFICTIKMQGTADHETTRAFAAIPGSHIVHLNANKNELTWICRYPS